jgi:hypothetical protein
VEVVEASEDCMSISSSWHWESVGPAEKVKTVDLPRGFVS